MTLKKNDEKVVELFEPDKTEEITKITEPEKAGEKAPKFFTPDGYENIRTGKILTALASCNPKKMNDVAKENRDPLERDVTISKNGCTFTFLDYLDYTSNAPESKKRTTPTAFRDSTIELLFALLAGLSRTRRAGDYDATEVHMHINEFMKLRDLKNKKQARDTVGKDLIILDSIRATWSQKIDGKIHSMNRIGICAGRAELTRGGEIIFRFTPEFLKAYNAYYYYPFPLSALKVDNKKNPGAFAMFVKIWQNKCINRGDVTENRVSVAALLEVHPTIPTVEQVRKGNRNFTKRIIEPFERDLKANEEIFTVARYCKHGGIPLTPEEEIRMYKDIDFFTTLMVDIHWIELEQNWPKKQVSGKSEEKGKGKGKGRKKKEKK